MKMMFLPKASLIVLSATLCFAQTKPVARPQTSVPNSQPPAKTVAKPAARNLSAQQKFVLDVVQTAVALPQGDPQDRLRVLTSAANVVSTVRPDLAKKFAAEGMRIEQELISAGERP